MSPDMLSRVFDGLRRPIDGGPELIPEKRLDVSRDPYESRRPELSAGVHPDRRLRHRRPEHPGKRSEAADLFSIRPAPRPARGPDREAGDGAGGRQRFAVVFAAMGITFEESNYFIESFRETGAIDRTVMFVNLANDPAVERIATPVWP